MMTIAQIMEKMIAFSEGNIHDITHLSCVWTYAKTIGELEGLDADTQFILEVAAITHDIACPLCRKKYGNTNGKYQEQEGVPVFFFVMLTERKNTGGPGHPSRPKKQNDIFWCPAAERRVEVCRIQRLNFRIPLIMINFVAFIRNA